MDISRFKFNDFRVFYKIVNVNGKMYRYILGFLFNVQEFIDIVFFCYGFFDMVFGWCCQIFVFMFFGFWVICFDMVGYVGIDVFKEFEVYLGKSVVDDVKELISQVIGEGQQIIFGGYDWGGQVVFCVVLWYLELVKGVFSVCMFYVFLNLMWMFFEDIVCIRFFNFVYQLQFVGLDVEQNV